MRVSCARGRTPGSDARPAPAVEVLPASRTAAGRPVSWTVVRRKWLGEQRFEHAAEEITFDTYLHAVDLVDARIEALERAIRETAEQGPWQELVARLRCLRGIDTLTACALIAEIGDFSRFRTAEAPTTLPPTIGRRGPRGCGSILSKWGRTNRRRGGLCSSRLRELAWVRSATKSSWLARQREPDFVASDTYFATALICAGVSWPLKAGITAPPLITCFCARAKPGFSLSRFGPTVPLVPASASV